MEKALIKLQQANSKSGPQAASISVPGKMKWPLLLSVVLPVLLSLLGVFYSSLPNYSGQVFLTGLKQQVEVTRDRLGVPTVTAATRQDALLGLGYVHAQDRLWAMDILRRTALGRLSELLGSEAFEIDLFARNLRIHALAEAAEKRLDATTSEDLKSYAEGVNAAVRRLTVLPPEYQLTWSRFEDWKPSDSLAILELMGVKWGFEFLRYHLTKLVGAELTSVLLPVEQGQHPIVDVSGEKHITGERLATEEVSGSSAHEETYRPGGFHAGPSSAWVVSGRFTQSHKPIIASDISTTASIPAQWYLANLKYSSLTISGGTVPGIPAILTGRNDNLAWTLTSLQADTIDLYLERLNPANPLEYLQGSAYHPLTFHQEDIFVRGEREPRHVQIEATKRGPILKKFTSAPGLFDTNFLSNGVDAILSLRWSLYEVEDTTMEAFIQLMESKDVSGVRVALKGVAAGAYGVLFAGVNDDIGFQAAGRIPNVSRRGKCANLPLEGWVHSNGWDGIIDFWDLPYIINPAKGYIIAAGNIPINSSYRYITSLGCDFSDNRSTRIDRLFARYIGNSELLTAAIMVSIQRDEYSTIAATLLPAILSFADEKARTLSVYSALQKWDFIMSKDKIEPTIYAELVSKLLRNILEDEVRNTEVLNALINSPSALHFLTVIFGSSTGNKGPERWCDSVQAAGSVTCSQLISSILQELNKKHHLKWGIAHEISLSHTPFSNSNWRFFFHRTVPIGGSTDTVHVEWYGRSRGFEVNIGSSLRLVMDLGTGRGYWGLATVSCT